MLIEEILDESRGLLFRSPGDRWRNEAGQEIALVKIQQYPELGRADAADLTQQFAQTQAELAEQGIEQIQLVNTRTGAHGAFAVAVFDVLDTDQQLAFGRWLSKTDPLSRGQWDNNDLAGFRLQLTGSIKSRSGLKPANLVKTEHLYSNPQQLVNDLRSSIMQLEWGQALFQGMQQLAQGAELEFAVPRSLEPAIRDDLGEIIAPLMLWQGRVPEAESARKAILGSAQWKSCKILFPAAQNAGLTDSQLISPDGISIGISSKGAAGAKASVSNVADALSALQDQNSALLRKPRVRKLKKILDVLMSERALVSPLVLGQQMQLISSEQAQAISDYFDLQQFAADAPAAALLARRSAHNISADPAYESLNSGSWALADQIRASKVYQQRAKNPGYRLGYHALSLVARAVAAQINSDPDFSQAALQLLNQTPLLQMHLYTRFAPTDNQLGLVQLRNWQVVFPLEFQGRLELKTDKAYWASGQSGRMTFGFSS